MSNYLVFNVSQQLRANEGRWPYVYDYCHYCNLGMSHPLIALPKYVLVILMPGHLATLRTWGT